MKHHWTKVVLGSALVTALALSTVGCSEGDDGQSGSTTTDPFTTTSTSLVTELAPPSTAEGDQSATTNTTGGGTGTSTTPIIVGGKTAEEYEASVPVLIDKAKTSPKDLAVLQELAIAQYQTQRYADASKTYESMLAIKDDAMTRNNRANVLRDWNKIDEAKSEYEKALTMDPKLVVAYINLVTLVLRTDADEAVAILDRGIAQTTGEDQQRLKDLKTSIKDQTATTGS